MLTHNDLKGRAKEILLSMGFQETEIFEEYSCVIDRKQYRIDMVGLSKNRTIAIECGNLDFMKYRLIKRLFTEIIHLPYNQLPMTEKGEDKLLTFEEKFYSKLFDSTMFTDIILYDFLQQEFGDDVEIKKQSLFSENLFSRQIKTLDETEWAYTLQYVFSLGFEKGKQPDSSENVFHMNKQQKERRIRF